MLCFWNTKNNIFLSVPCDLVLPRRLMHDVWEGAVRSSLDSSVGHGIMTPGV